MSSAAARDQESNPDDSNPIGLTGPPKRPLKQVAGISEEILDGARQVAFNLYLVDRFADAQLVLEGILAADPGDAWALSVYAAILRKQNKLRGALVLLQSALSLDPGDRHIRRMRDEVATDLARRRSVQIVEIVKKGKEVDR